MRLVKITLCVLSLCSSLNVSAQDKHNKAEDELKLIVVISVDQLRRDRMTDELPGFLGELYRKGRVYKDASLDHGITTTCGGHATILTGMPPGPIGIPGNVYIDDAFQRRYCVDDKNDEHKVIGRDVNRSPLNMKASTFGDWLKKAHKTSKVFSVGGKDRSTITMGGQNPDGVFWYDSSNGRFTTSTYYMDQLPDYVDRFNGSAPLIDGYLKDIPDYWQHEEGSHRIDDYEGEDEVHSRTSGHPLAKAEGENSVFEQIYRSPVIDTQSLRLAQIVIEQESLGQNEEVDLLILALSAIDTVGHNYGPRSAESEATLKTLDKNLSDFFLKLEESVSKERLLVVLTADHGVAELPEFTTSQGRNSCPEQGRLAIWPLFIKARASAYWHFTAPFDGPGELMTFGDTGFSFNRQYMLDNDLEVDDVLNTLKETIEGSDIVKQAWTQAEILEGKGEVARLLRNSFTPNKSPDLQLQLHRDCVITYGAGTTHGSIYDYDRDIPLIFYGWNISEGHISGKAHSVNIGPSLANHIGLETPKALYAKPLNLIEPLK